MTPMSTLMEFAEAYAVHRAAEGRKQSGAELRRLPYIARGPFAEQWRVRARTYDAFVTRILRPLASSLGRAPRLLDVGAGCGWLARRAALAGCPAIALDIRADDVDGLGAAGAYADDPAAPFVRIVATFDALPVESATADVVVFNAALHYSTNLERTLAEAHRVLRAGGRIALLDSPFYGSRHAGETMVAEKRQSAAHQFGALAGALMGLSCIEYLTPEQLSNVSAPLGITWRRHRVWYPLSYELRPIIARLRGRRTPSRFDLWEGVAA